MRRFERYVAIGDSSTEGLDDPDGRGGYRGWANRLAERIADAQGPLLYANLAVRGLRTRQVLEEQLDRALALEPDLATVFSGMNDLIAPRFDGTALGRDITHMLGTLTAGGATVLTFTMPDFGPVMPIARLLTGRVRALNAALRDASRRTGARLVDLGRYPVAADPRMWSEDRLHANAAGHARIAAALGQALGLPGMDDAWSRPLPAMPRRGLMHRAGGEARWVAGYLLPWLLRHARGRSSGDGRQPKQPELVPIRPTSLS